MNGDPDPVAGVLSQLAAKWGIESPRETGRLFSAWVQIVGADVARRCEPTALKDGCLRVRTDSAAWAGELKYLAPEIIRRVNTELGKTVVTSVKAWVGKPREGAPRARKNQAAEGLERPLPKPTKFQEEQAAKLTSEIPDSKVAEAAKKALLAAKIRNENR
ncbi:MAG TPA: DUF721 domain-containing protein [Actinomycetota bacterium]|nr:DUF721 domain-containing protein [Actinomycetota bacterium]